MGKIIYYDKYIVSNPIQNYLWEILYIWEKSSWVLIKIGVNIYFKWIEGARQTHYYCVHKILPMYAMHLEIKGRAAAPPFP